MLKKWTSERFQAYSDCFFSIIATLMVTSLSKLEENERELIEECEDGTKSDPACDKALIIFERVRSFTVIDSGKFFTVPLLTTESTEFCGVFPHVRNCAIAFLQYSPSITHLPAST